MTKIIIYICRAGGGSTDVSVYKDDQVDTRSDGIQRICAYHLFTGLSPSAQSCQLSPWTTSAMVRVSNDDNNYDRFYALHAFVAAVLVVPVVPQPGTVIVTFGNRAWNFELVRLLQLQKTEVIAGKLKFCVVNLLQLSYIL